MRSTIVALLLLVSTSAAAQDLCVSRVSLVESQNIVALQSKWSDAPQLSRGDAMWSHMFAALVGADFPVEVETAIDGATIWWRLDGLTFKQTPSNPAKSIEEALMAPLTTTETEGSMRIELDGEGCYKATLDAESLVLQTPNGNQLRITAKNLRRIKNATKNKNARVFRYKGASTFKLSRGGAGQTDKNSVAGPSAPPPVVIDRLDQPTFDGFSN